MGTTSHAAIVLTESNPLSIQEVSVDEPRAGEVQVRIVATGVCHADLITRDGWYGTKFPGVLGHEGSGIVEKLGPDVTDIDIGDHVVLSYDFCGRCTQCRSGHPAHCENFFALNFGGSRTDGSTAFSDTEGHDLASHFFGQSAFSELTNVSVNCVVAVPKHLALEQLGPLGCGVQTGAGAVLNVLRPEAGSSVVVFGTGAVGFSALLASVVASATTIIAVDVIDSRLETAKELGATHTINSKNEDAVTRIKEITNGGADYGLLSVGNTGAFRQMIDSLGVRGHGAVVGAASPGSEAQIPIGDILFTGAQISFVIEGDSVPQTFIPHLLSLYEQGRFPFDKLSKTYPLTEINQAFSDTESGTTIKPIMLMPTS